MLAFPHPAVQFFAADEAERNICARFWKFIPLLHDTVLDVLA